MFFATDIHGSEVCWKKFLNSGAHYKADVVILGGDMTGKALIPGIEDQLEVDRVVAHAKTVELGEGRVVDIGDYQLASSGWANRTPWDTYREEDEDVLLERIERMVAEVTNEPERTIFNLHCPPYNTGLDEAPQLTADMTLKDAGRATVPVGSTAVRQAIERHQPALALHGHIHEARGTHRLGTTLCINPGSTYEQGQLLGVVVDLDGKKKKVKNFVLTSG